MTIEFSGKQQATIASALTLCGVMLIVGVVLGLFYLLGAFVALFASVLLPLAVAAILALVFMPFYGWLRGLFNGRDVPAVITFYLSVLLPLGLLVWFFGAVAVGQLSEFVEKAPGLLQRNWQQLQERWPDLLVLWEQHSMNEQVRSLVEEQGGVIAGGLKFVMQKLFVAGVSVFSSVAGLFSWAVLPIYLAFFLIMKPITGIQLEGFLPFLKPETRQDLIYLVREFINILVAFFRGQLLVALGQGILFAIGFMVVGLEYAFVLGLLLGFLNIIPYLGSMVGLGIALPLALFQPDGGVTLLALVILVFIIVQVIEGYLLTPKIMGDRTGLHPLVIMIALFFWGTALNGIMGMILAIPLTAFLVIFWRLIKEKYIKELI